MKKQDIESLKKIIKGITHGIGDIRKGNLQGAEITDYLSEAQKNIIEFKEFQKKQFDKMPSKAKHGFEGDMAEEAISVLEDSITYMEDIIQQYPDNKDNDWLRDNLDEVAGMLEELTEEDEM